MNRSVFSFVDGDFRVLEAIRRNITAAKERTYCDQVLAGTNLSRMRYGKAAYCSIVGTHNLLDEAHQKHFRSGRRPVVLQMILGLRTDIVVGRLQSLQKLRQLGTDLGWKYRHDRYGFYA